MRLAHAVSLSIAFASACSSSHPIRDISVSTGDLVPSFSPNIHDYEVTSLTTMFPVTITVAGDAMIDGISADDGAPHALTLTSLDDATSIAIDGVDARGNAVTYTLHTVPNNRPRFSVTTLDAPAPGQILLAPNELADITVVKPSFLYVLDETGRIIFYKAMPTFAFDFERWTLPNGAVRYTYIAVDQAIDWTTWPIESCTAYVLDDHFRQLRTVRFAPTSAHAANGVDAHDFRLVDDDHWISLSYIGETVTNVAGFATSNVVAALVQEVENDAVSFDWNTTSAPALYTDSTEGNDFTDQATAYADYNHLNSVDIDPSNGNFVVSLRHDDAIVELDHATGSIVWTLGGASDQFGLAAADKTSHQHHARFLEANHLLVFDNGNASKLSKIREYQIDPQGHTANVLAAVTVDGHYTSAMGSVQKRANRYFVGWGLHAAGQSDVTELDAATQKKSFEMSFQNGYASYRALKY